MGQKLKILTIMTSMILLSGILGFGFSAYAQESPADLPPQAEAGTAAGCEVSDDRSNERASAAARNPHCEDDTPPPDPLPASDCDKDSNGEITAAEIEACFGPEIDPVTGQQIIDQATIVVTNDNDVIDTADELVELNAVLELFGLPPGSC